MKISKYWIYLIGVSLVFVFALFFYVQRQEILLLPIIFAQANPAYLFLGLFITMASFVSQAIKLLLSYRTINKEIKFDVALSIYLKRFFIGAFFPGGYTVSQFSYTKSIQEEGIDNHDTHLASMLFIITSVIAFAIIFIPASIIFYDNHSLSGYEIFLILISFLCIGLVISEFIKLYQGKGFIRPFLKKNLPKLYRHLLGWENQVIKTSDLIKLIGFAIFAQLINVLVLGVSILAIHGSFSISATLFCYLASTFLAFVSPTLQGLGLVEFGMVLALNRAGIPSSESLTITLLFRGLQFWLPFVLGLMLIFQNQIRRSARVISICLTFFLGVIDIISAVSRPIANKLISSQHYLPLQVVTVSRVSMLVLGFLLLLVSINLFRHSKRAWQIAVVLIILSFVAHITKGFNIAESLLSLLVFLSLWITRREYRRQYDPPSFRRALIVMILGLGSIIFYGAIGFYFLDHRYFGTNFSFAQSLTHIARIFFTFNDPTLVSHRFFARLFLDTVYGLSIFTYVYMLIVLFEPVYYQLRTLPHELVWAKHLRDWYGVSTLDYFKLYWDKQIFISRSRQAFLAYKVENNYALVLGDPIGSNFESIRQCLKEFEEFTQINSWGLCVFQIDDRWLSNYESYGWQSIKIGEEAVVDLPHFNLEGSKMKDLRNSVNRISRQGCEVRIVDPLLDRHLLRQLRDINHSWLKQPFRNERIFSQSIFRESDFKDTPVAVLYSPQKKPLAFISLILDPKKQYVALDMIRRMEKIPNGGMEFLITETIFYFQKKQYQFFSLGLAPLAGIDNEDEQSLPERTLDFIYRNANIGFSYQGLRHFKERFLPAWQPRYLLYKHKRQLPGIAWGLLWATQIKPPFWEFRLFSRHKKSTYPGQFLN